MILKSMLFYTLTISAVFVLACFYFQTERILMTTDLNEIEPNVKQILHFVIPLCRGEEEMYEIFMTNLNKIKKGEWDFRVLVIYQMDNRLCLWPALIYVGLKHSIIQGEAKCIIIQSVYQLPQEGFDYGKCLQPTKICLRQKKCLYDNNDQNNIYYEAMTASPKHWKQIMEYNNQTKVNYESLYNNLNGMLQLLDKNTELRHCKCIDTLHYNVSSKLSNKLHPPYKIAEWHFDDFRNTIYFTQDTHVDSWDTTWLNVEPWTIDQLQNRNVVLPKHKLIYFPNLKSGSTYWKYLLYYVEFRKPRPRDGHGHLFLSLKDYSDREALDMLFGENWTKFTIVREPRERILSAYLHKAVRQKHVQNSFCKADVRSFSAFVDLIKTCKNVHWKTQVYLPRILYKNMLIGRMGRRHNITFFMETLLKEVDAWESVKQWMVSSASLESTKHPTDAKDQIKTHYNKNLERKIIDMYKSEYEVFGFDKSFYT